MDGLGGLNSDCEVAVIGGGIVGLATALALVEREGREVLLLEAESGLAAHQTGHNSGVIHAGLYYRPGSLKARLCAEGREALFTFCEAQGLPYERCGKLVLATRPEELGALDALAERGRTNGLEGLRRLSAEDIPAIEPQARGLAGLWVPQTGIVDYGAVARAMAERFEAAGGRILKGARLTSGHDEPSGMRLETSAGRLRCRQLVTCAGLQADRVARRCGVRPDLRIIPFRGEYLRLVEARRDLVRGLIYPVPDPRLPFLGVHFTRRVDGSVEAGPNAVLAWRREGYGRLDVSLGDSWSSLSYPGFWRLARRFWRVGWAEQRRSFSRRRFASDLARLLPGIRPADLEPGGAGVRAQALARDGRLLDDFRILRGARAIHVLNAPSPAATAALAIGRQIAAEARAAMRTA